MNHHLRLVHQQPKESETPVSKAPLVILGATLGYAMLVIYLVTAG